MTQPIRPDPAEIAWHSWISDAELDAVSRRPEFVPDALEALVHHRERRNGCGTPRVPGTLREGSSPPS
ncbi:hypothetical protein ACFWAP_22760 [Streptomyces goshikiensis]|uniref:hypothetical protein n=1 Tax=Streptomyces goshikiensis TaxID=1942 RepID=UPI00364E80B4